MPRGHSRSSCLLVFHARHLLQCRHWSMPSDCMCLACVSLYTWSSSGCSSFMCSTRSFRACSAVERCTRKVVHTGHVNVTDLPSSLSALTRTSCVLASFRGVEVSMAASASLMATSVSMSSSSVAAPSTASCVCSRTCPGCMSVSSWFSGVLAGDGGGDGGRVGASFPGDTTGGSS